MTDFFFILIHLLGLFVIIDFGWGQPVAFPSCFYIAIKSSRSWKTVSFFSEKIVLWNLIPLTTCMVQHSLGKVWSSSRQDVIEGYLNSEFRLIFGNFRMERSEIYTNDWQILFCDKLPMSPFCKILSEFVVIKPECKKLRQKNGWVFCVFRSFALLFS